MAGIIHWLEHHLLPCPYKRLTGLDCPGCGMQRAFLALIQGHFRESFLLYPALLPVLITFLLTAIHLKYKLTHGAAYIKYSYIITLVLVMGSYIWKLFYGKV